MKGYTDCNIKYAFINKNIEINNNDMFLALNVDLNSIGSITKSF